MGEEEGRILGHGDVIDVEYSPSWTYFLKQTWADVNLKDPPIIVLVLFFVLWFILMYKTRRNTRLSILIFGLTCLAIGFSPRINAFMGDQKSSKWAVVGFSKNYFDFSGYFILMFWAGPLILEAVIFLLIFGWNVARTHWSKGMEWIFGRIRRDDKNNVKIKAD
jgi:hypothetical protein